jgi:hypothetical protein
MGAISGKRATDERVTCLRIFADANGETHMEDVDIILQPKQLFKDNPPLRLTDNFAAYWYNICYVPSGMHEVDWHNPPQRLLVLWLTGQVEFETSDGDIRRLPAGSVVLAEDTTGKGHISVTLLRVSLWCTWHSPTVKANHAARPLLARL